MGCEPTYKELKQDFLYVLPHNYLRCEPTYKELKLSNYNYILPELLSCEPTYKELKLSFSRKETSPHSLLRAYL
mgnify:CR=1 FL=1